MFTRRDDDKDDKDKQTTSLLGNKNSDIEANTNVEPTTTQGGTTAGTTTRSQGLDRFAGDNVDWGDTCCGSPQKKWCWGIGVFAIFVILLVLLIMSLKRLESTEYGLEYHPRKKKLDEEPQQGGLHFGPPGYEFIKFPSTFIVSIQNDVLKN